MQQIIALLLIIFFIFRLVLQRKIGKLAKVEFLLWLVFWSFSALIVIFIKQIDQLVAYLGFSSSGINVLLYLAIALLFYLLFRTRLQIEKLKKEITVIIQKMALSNKGK